MIFTDSGSVKLLLRIFSDLSQFLCYFLNACIYAPRKPLARTTIYQFWIPAGIALHFLPWPAQLPVTSATSCEACRYTPRAPRKPPAGRRNRREPTMYTHSSCFFFERLVEACAKAAAYCNAWWCWRDCSPPQPKPPSPPRFVSPSDWFSWMPSLPVWTGIP